MVPTAQSTHLFLTELISSACSCRTIKVSHDATSRNEMKCLKGGNYSSHGLAAKCFWNYFFKGSTIWISFFKKFPLPLHPFKMLQLPTGNSYSRCDSSYVLKNLQKVTFVQIYEQILCNWKKLSSCRNITSRESSCGRTAAIRNVKGKKLSLIASGDC